jgi:hypothetical protein
LAIFKDTFRYSKKEAWSLFLVAAFAIHIWTIILILRDLSWVSERTNAWDAVGVAAYGLFFAFLESGIVFLGLVLLGMLVGGKWRETRLALLTVLYFVTAAWAAVGQLYFLLGLEIPASIFRQLIHSSHPLQVLYGSVLILVLITIVPPTVLVIRSNKANQLIKGLIDRLSLLTIFYLFLDFAGLVIIILRNI